MRATLRRGSFKSWPNVRSCRDFVSPPPPRRSRGGSNFPLAKTSPYLLPTFPGRKDRRQASQPEIRNPGPMPDSVGKLEGSRNDRNGPRKASYVCAPVRRPRNIRATNPSGSEEPRNARFGMRHRKKSFYNVSSSFAEMTEILCYSFFDIDGVRNTRKTEKEAGYMFVLFDSSADLTLAAITENPE